MITIIFSTAAFFVMLLFPVVLGLFFLRKSGGEALEIQQARVRDPRYFAKSFASLFDNKWETYDGSGQIFLSCQENLLEADTQDKYPPVCTSIVFAEQSEFRAPPGVRFEKEVYARHNSYFNDTEVVRAVCCKKDLVLGKGTQVMRWVDAEGLLSVYDGCDLGISASSATKIMIGKNCRFRRLYAPVIFLGQALLESPRKDDSQSVDLESDPMNVTRNIKYVDDDNTHAGILTGSIVTKYDLTVLDNLTVKGHIRSHNGIKLCDGAVVYGNLFAEGDIYLGRNTSIYGSVFTQESIFAERGVIIGQHDKTKSVIARGEIVFNEDSIVYGFISSETVGECCPV